MPDLDLDAIRARCDAATPGPWRWRGNVDHDDPRLAGPKTDVLGHVRCERRLGDREALSFAEYLRDCQVFNAETNTYRPYTEQEIAKRVRDEWLNDPWGEPRTDVRLAFVDDRHLYREARELAVFEVCPDATTRDDPRVYRADIVGLRHPDAVFLAAAREDVPALIAEVERLRAELAAMRPPIPDYLTAISAGGVESCGCLANYAGAHRVGCPDHPQGYAPWRVGRDNETPGEG